MWCNRDRWMLVGNWRWQLKTLPLIPYFAFFQSFPWCICLLKSAVELCFLLEICWTIEVGWQSNASCWEKVVVLSSLLLSLVKVYVGPNVNLVDLASCHKVQLMVEKLIFVMEMKCKLELQGNFFSILHVLCSRQFLLDNPS